MNPVLVMLILMGAFVLWLLCSFLYKPLGKLASRLWEDAMEEMNEEKENKNGKER